MILEIKSRKDFYKLLFENYNIEELAVFRRSKKSDDRKRSNKKQKKLWKIQSLFVPATLGVQTSPLCQCDAQDGLVSFTNLSTADSQKKS